MKPILVSGSLVYDHIMNFPDSFRNHILPEQVHILSVSFVVDHLQNSRGGTAGNIAFSTKLLGGEPLIVSAVGADGHEYLDYFRSKGIATDHIIVDDGQPTASAYITTDVDDNQIAAFYSGPLRRAAETNVAGIGAPGCIAIVAPTDKQAMMRHAQDAAGAGMRVVFDPGQQMTAFKEAELKHLIDISEFVIGNDYEMKLIEDRTQWTARDIVKHTKVMITTLGERGSVIATEDEIIEIKPCPPRSFDDPTGAGDAYRAGFFVGLSRGFDYTTCGRMGSVAASYAIETYGTQAHEFTKEEFCDRFKKTYEAALSL